MQRCCKAYVPYRVDQVVKLVHLHCSSPLTPSIPTPTILGIPRTMANVSSTSDLHFNDSMGDDDSDTGCASAVNDTAPVVDDNQAPAVDALERS